MLVCWYVYIIGGSGSQDKQFLILAAGSVPDAQDVWMVRPKVKTGQQGSWLSGPVVHEETRFTVQGLRDKGRQGTISQAGDGLGRILAWTESKSGLVVDLRPGTQIWDMGLCGCACACASWSCS